jgi:hypothetical protein
LVRVTLDQVRGSKFEYSTNAGADPFITIHDALGDAMYTGQGGAKNTGSSSPVWLGFGQFDGAAGTTIIDDIVLESTVVIPEPATWTLVLVALVSMFSVRRR